MTPASARSMTKGERTRRKLIDAAASLMRRHGYHGTGLGQIIAESGSPKGSLYFHFPGGKEELACAAIDAAGERWRAAVNEAIGAADGLAAKVTAVGELLASELETTGFADGCPVATIALETSSESDAIRERCAAVYGAWRELIAKELEAVGVTGEAGQSLARFALSAFEGAMLVARVERRGDAVRETAAMLASMIPG